MLRKRWRVLGYETRAAAMNLALDDAIAEAMLFRIAGPTIRFYGWRPAAVSIGRSQDLHEVVDLDRCRELGVQVVRRCTEGEAFFHDQDKEISYSVICPEDMMPTDPQEACAEISGWVVNALRLLGIEASLESHCEVLVDGKRIGLGSQLRRQGVFMQHGTFIYDLDRARMSSLLRTSGQGAKGGAEMATSVREHKKTPWEYAMAALTNAFIMNKQWYAGDLSHDEMVRAERIVNERYGKDEWTFGR
jgi:lipoate-protein ligase A